MGKITGSCVRLVGCLLFLFFEICFVGPSEANQFYFTGKPLDDETGLYYYGGRYYDPAIGRFIRPDELIAAPQNPQELNRYSYTANNPINRLDPSGHSWKKFWQRYGNWISPFGRAVVTEDWKTFGTTVAASIGMISGATPLVLASGLQLLSVSTKDFPGKTWQQISQDLGYASVAISTAYMAWNIGVGTRDWLYEYRKVNPAGFYDLSGNRIDPKLVSGKIFVNGVATDFHSALLSAADRGSNYLFYNPTSGPIADFTECFLQKITLTSSIDRQFAAGLAQISGKVNIVAHSQGTILSTNALINLGFRGKNVVEETSLLAPAVSQPKILLSQWMSGSHVSYGLNFFDPISIVGPNLNPFRLAGGLIGGLLFQAKFHSLNFY